MLLGQESLRRALGLSESIVLVADSNAAAVGFPRQAVERVAAAAEGTLRNVGEMLGLPLQFVRGSEIAPWSAVARCSSSKDDPYDAHQLAQMAAMAERGATVKVGWVMSAGSHDEAYFDGLFESRFPGAMSFVYSVCGRALNHRRPRVCPYVATHPGQRIMLETGERIEAKLASATQEDEREVAGYRRLLRKIGRSLAQIHGGRAPRDAELLVQDLITSSR